MSLRSDSTPLLLFERGRRRRRRDRAAAGLSAVDFLHREAASMLADRLSVINRRFRAAAVFGAAPGAVGDALLDAGIDQLIEIDPSPCAAALLRQRRGGGALVIAGDADAAPLAPESQDLAVSVFDLHALNDPVGALVQARRALRPDGLFLGVLFGAGSLTELRDCLGEAEVAETGGLSPRVTPFGEVRDLGALLQRAGFALPVADCDRLTLWYSNPLALMREIRALGESNALAARLRRPTRRTVFARAAALYQERYARADGKIPATVELVTLTGWAPAPDQQQPLRPGSARARLADALGVSERSAGEKAG